MNLASSRIKRTARMLYMNVRDTDSEVPPVDGGRLRDEPSVPLVIATMLRGDGITGVETHIRQLRRYLKECGTANTLVTPFSWSRSLTYPVFGLRPLVLERCSRPAGLAWYLHWHEVFLRQALGRLLAKTGDCVIDTQDPFAARAALRARRGPHQRVVMTVHFSVSTADLWVDKRQIKRDGTVFRAIRQLEGEVIPQIDGLVYVSRWAQDALVDWLPEAAAVPSAVISNFVAPLHAERPPQALGDLVTIGNLEIAKNHRFLLEVLAEAKHAGRSLSLDIFGEGPCRGELLRQARSLGLEEQVRFHGFRPDVRDLLPGYRVYVHASYTESSSLAIMEAMAAGLPIVAGDIGPISELCDDGIEGRFWPLDDPARAAVLLMDLLDSEPELLKAARAARERFHRHYNADVVGPKLLSFLMGNSQGPRAEARYRHRLLRADSMLSWGDDLGVLIGRTAPNLASVPAGDGAVLPTRASFRFPLTRYPGARLNERHLMGSGLSVSSGGLVAHLNKWRT